ncbi:ATP-binding protein [Microbacterium sp. NPDC089189]|uniref:ATP-binding protein n=1 Tax=Microbacterium sp. NPDC089189 TaxID=3154972 RepID=UPI00341FBC01
MPLLQLQTTRRGRVRVFLRAQLPFSVAVVALVAGLWVAAPTVLVEPLVLAGLALAAAASVLALVVPWERLNPNGMVLIAVADIVAVALLRTVVIGVIPGVALLALFPILWLAYGFHQSFIWVAVAGAAFITVFDYVRREAWPETALQWVNLLMLPVITSIVVVGVNLAARQLRRSQDRLTLAHRRQAVALRQAHDNEILVRSILDTVASGVSFYDADGVLVLRNGTARRMAELAGNDSVRPPYAGVHVLAADRESVVPPEAQSVQRALAGEEFTDLMEWVGPADRQVALHVTSRRALRENQQLLGTVVAGYDVTEFAHAAEVREHFLRTVSHELRTPVTNITGYLDLLTENIEVRGEREQGYLDAVHRNSRRLVDRMQELLAATQTAKPLVLESTDAVRMVGAVIAQTRAQALHRGITLERIGDAESPVRIDRQRVHQALRELVTNAIKFADPHSAVTVEHHADGDTLTVSVTNSGSVIGPAEQVRLFDRFYRTPLARRNAVQGFGIGLSVVRDAVAAHGGRVHVASSREAGTRFTMEIPAS